MGNRRDFLRKFGIGFGIFAISPQLLKALDRSEGLEPTIQINKNTTVESIRGSLDELDELDRELTEKFFNYLKNTNVGFNWERVYTPVFQLNVEHDNKPMVVASRKFHTNFNLFWNEGFGETISDSPSASTYTYRQYDTLDEYYDVLFTQFCQELRRNPAPNRFYIYQLRFTPHIYNPTTFEPFKGVIIRYAKI